MQFPPGLISGRDIFRFFWTRFSGFGFRVLDFGLWKFFGLEFWILNFEFWIFYFFFIFIFSVFIFILIFFWFSWIFLWFCFRCPGHSVWARYFYISKVLVSGRDLWLFLFDFWKFFDLNLKWTWTWTSSTQNPGGPPMSTCFLYFLIFLLVNRWLESAPHNFLLSQMLPDFSTISGQKLVERSPPQTQYNLRNMMS